MAYYVCALGHVVPIYVQHRLASAGEVMPGQCATCSGGLSKLSDEAESIYRLGGEAALRAFWDGIFKPPAEGS